MASEIELKRQLEKISMIMNFLEGSDGKRLHWFYCFGTLQEYISDSTFSFDSDIDIGVLYDQCDAVALENMITSNGYKLEKKLVNDVTKKPFNMQFKPVDDGMLEWPSLDIYFWYKHNKMLYHTYDVNKENLEIPSKYIFKGVKEEWISPNKEMIAAKRAALHPGYARSITEHGTWVSDIFGSSSGFEFVCPYAYGSLLDEWYPNWKFRKHNVGQSKSRFMVEMRSCKEWTEK